MTDCMHAGKANAYYDEELSSEERTEFAEHLPTCPSCRRDVEENGALSELLASADVPEISQAGLERLHRSIAGLFEPGLQRVAKALAVAAVALMVIGSTFAWRLSASTGPEGAWVEQWEEVTLTPPVGDLDLENTETNFADWMMATLLEEAIDE